MLLMQYILVRVRIALHRATCRAH